MKKKALWAVFALMVGLSVSGMVCLANEEGSAQKHVEGEIVSVDPAGGTLALKEPGLVPPAPDVQPLQFVVDAKTTVLKDNSALALGDLKSGDLVTVEYSATADNKLAASSIVVESKEVPAAASSPAPASETTTPPAQ